MAAIYIARGPDVLMQIHHCLSCLMRYLKMTHNIYHCDIFSWHKGGEGRERSYRSIRSHSEPTKEEIIDDNLFNDLMCFIQYLKRALWERSSILSNNRGRKQYNTSSPVNFSLRLGVPQGSIPGINKSETSFSLTPPSRGWGWFCIYPWFIGPHQSSIVRAVRIKPNDPRHFCYRPPPVTYL